MPHAFLADLVLLVHVGVVAFVVLGLPTILIGNRREWPWVNRRGWRVVHLVAIAVVVVQAWLGRFCGLTTLESRLRQRAGEEGYAGGFIQHWTHRLLYYDVPLEVLAAAYTVFGLAVAWAWHRYPPMPGRRD